MDCLKRVAPALEYIEENLRGELPLSALACAAGYSEYHFARIFRTATGHTPANYIRKRRLTEIARRICGDAIGDERFICDIAFSFGFNSKENFIRAFKAEHRILPTEYRASGCSLHLFDGLPCRSSELTIEPFLTELPGFRLVALLCDEEHVPRFWNKYNAGHWSARLTGGAVVRDIGACRVTEAGVFEYYCGVDARDARGDTSGAVTLDIPGGLYAIFRTPPATQSTFVATIHATWAYIAQNWLPEHRYRRTGGFEFESYVESSREFSEKIYIPITKGDV